jgi:hypothetical protein
LWDQRGGRRRCIWWLSVDGDGWVCLWAGHLRAEAVMLVPRPVVMCLLIEVAQHRLQVREIAWVNVHNIRRRAAQRIGQA